jgi:RNA polymerase sigma-70 factor (ECF subfamily)
MNSKFSFPGRNSLFYGTKSFIHEMKTELNDKADLALLEYIQADREDAFEVLFKRYYTALYRFTCRIIKDPQDAENIVQDLFVRFWEKRSEINIESNLKAYLFTSAKNHSLNYIKRERRLTLLDDNSEIQKENAESPETVLIKDETVIAVQNAINKLPEKCREIYMMKKYDDLSYQEISKVLKISVNTVKTQMKRAVKSLSQHLSYLKVSVLYAIIQLLR